MRRPRSNLRSRPFGRSRSSEAAHVTRRPVAGRVALAPVAATALWAAITLAGFAPPALAAIDKTPYMIREYSRAGADWNEALAVSPTGALYSAGAVTTTAQGSNLVVELVSVWKHTWDSPAHLEDVALDVAVGPDGAVYVTGYAGIPPNGGDFVLLKYSASGVRRWVRRWHVAGAIMNAGRSIAFDTSGNVVALARVALPAGARGAVLKYTPSGTRLWVRMLESTNNPLRTFVPTDMVVSASGIAYVAGWTGDGLGNDDAFVASVSNAGSVRWTRRYKGPADIGDSFFAMCLRPAGGVYAAGISDSGPGDSAGVVCAVGPNGVVTPVARLGDSDGLSQWLNDVAVNGHGELAVCGVWQNASEDFYAALLRKDGTVKWQQSIGWAGDDWAAALTVDGRDRVTVTGFIALGPAVLTASYPRQGQMSWYNYYMGPGPGNSLNVYDIARYKASKVWITGGGLNGVVNDQDRFVVGWKQ